MRTSLGERVVYRSDWQKPFEHRGILEGFASESYGTGEGLEVYPVAIIRKLDGTFTTAYVWNMQLAGEAESAGAV